MSRGYDTVRGWLEISEEAFCDGERKTCEDMLREAHKSLKLFQNEMTPAQIRECKLWMEALVRTLNAHIRRPGYAH